MTNDRYHDTVWNYWVFLEGLNTLYMDNIPQTAIYPAMLIPKKSGVIQTVIHMVSCQKLQSVTNAHIIGINNNKFFIKKRKNSVPEFSKSFLTNNHN